MSEFYECAEEICVKCGELQVSAVCNTCGGEGWTEYGELYEQDPLLYDPDDIKQCDECFGHGHRQWCQQCGWDSQGFYLGWPLVGPIKKEAA